MKPVYKRFVFGGVHVSVYGASRNWNFAGETAQAIETGNPGITAALAEVMVDNQISRAWVPKPMFNALVTEFEQLSDERLPKFFRGADADGVILLNPGDAYMLASADCLCAVLFDQSRNIAVATHCGRDALIDRGHLAGKPSRRFASVIDAAMMFLSNYSSSTEGVFSPSNVRVFLAAGIGPTTFTHPTTETVLDSDGLEQPNKYQKANDALIGFLWSRYQVRGFPVVTDLKQGCIDLVELVTAQLDEHGVTQQQIEWDGVDTALDTDASGQFLFHSCRRDNPMRNLVVVTLL